MELTTGMIVVLVAMVLFYLRVAMLRGQKKRYEREYALKRRKVHGRSKGAALPQNTSGTPPYQITSWWLVALAIFLAITGVIMNNKMTILSLNIINNPAFVDKYSEFWYIPVAAGVLIFALCFTVQKPKEDEK